MGRHYKNHMLVKKLSRRYVSPAVKWCNEAKRMKLHYEALLNASAAYDVVDELVLFYMYVERVLSCIVRFVARRNNKVIRADSLFGKLVSALEYLNEKGVSLVVDYDVFTRFSDLRNRYQHGCEVPRDIERIKIVSREVYKIIVGLIGKFEELV